MIDGMISIVWPYWRRGAEMLRGLASMEQHYGGRSDVEIVVVDDGSPENTAKESLDRSGMTRTLPVNLIELPRKDGPKNPCVPINRGVAAARGEFILLTNPETTHNAPILGEMRGEIARRGRKTYVLAAAWCPQSGSWHCHSERASAGYHFCTMLHRDLWDSCGGFDEEYRDGYCYDDPDFVQRLIRSEAEFVFRDDLIAEHHQDGAAKHSMPRELWDRNRNMFERKWPAPRAIKQGKPFTEALLQNWQGA